MLKIFLATWHHCLQISNGDFFRKRGAMTKDLAQNSGLDQQQNIYK